MKLKLISLLIIVLMLFLPITFSETMQERQQKILSGITRDSPEYKEAIKSLRQAGVLEPSNNQITNLILASKQEIPPTEIQAIALSRNFDKPIAEIEGKTLAQLEKELKFKTSDLNNEINIIGQEEAAKLTDEETQVIMGVVSNQKQPDGAFYAIMNSDNPEVVKAIARTAPGFKEAQARNVLELIKNSDDNVLANNYNALNNPNSLGCIALGAYECNRAKSQLFKEIESRKEVLAAAGEEFPTELTDTTKPISQPVGQYIVQEGDTLSTISDKSGVDVDTLLRANPKIIDPDKIYAGQRIAFRDKYEKITINKKNVPLCKAPK